MQLNRASHSARVRAPDIFVDLQLDANGQTRVDVVSVLLNRKRDLGANARRIRRFIDELDTKLDATAGQILDPTSQPQFSG